MRPPSETRTNWNEIRIRKTVIAVSYTHLDVYKRQHLLCEATLKVLEKRMEQSKAMIFVVSENSRNSVWCKYELNYFTELGKPIYCISKEAIDEKNFHLNKMSDTWFLDSDYKRLALIEGESIKMCIRDRALQDHAGGAAGVQGTCKVQRF